MCVCVCRCVCANGGCENWRRTEMRRSKRTWQFHPFLKKLFINFCRTRFRLSGDLLCQNARASFHRLTHFFLLIRLSLNYTCLSRTGIARSEAHDVISTIHWDHCFFNLIPELFATQTGHYKYRHLNCRQFSLCFNICDETSLSLSTRTT